MAKLKQLQDKDGNNIFPLTIPQGIADPSSGEKLSDTLSSIKTFMQTVNDFLDAVNASDEAINSWKELENFLNGITDTETLTGLLSDTLAQAKAYADETAKNAEYDLPVATSSKLGGVLSGGDISVGTSGSVTVSHATSADTARSVYGGTSTDIEAEWSSEESDLDIRTGGNVIVESNYRNVVIRSGSGTVEYGTGSVQIKGDTSIDGDLTVSGSISGVLTCVACNDTTDYPELTI